MKDSSSSTSSCVRSRRHRGHSYPKHGAGGDLSGVIRLILLCFSTRTRSRALAASVALLVLSGRAVRAQASAMNAPASPSQSSPATLGGFELTAVQKAKIDSIAAKHSAEMRAVGDLFSTNPGEGMKRMVALRTRMQKEVRVILTRGQRAIFDRNVAEMNAQMNAHMPSAAR